ncbi:ficolin-2-like isoform X1 [Teleopsis dalmanni]|uniref:ficolin-2-like isoform X1 n=1 Tax=Teleopsis dalmanni TaxID=139649 RepID=UPI0018CE8B03|nr:ficolin-2-like isoform X1 [Teleopsis dalmanni]
MRNSLIILSILKIIAVFANENCIFSTEPTNQSTSFFFDDTLVKNVGLQIELLNASNENLRLRLDAINMRIEAQTVLLAELNSKIESQPIWGRERDPPIDIRFGVDSTEDNNKNSHNNKFKNITCAPKLPSSCSEAAAITRKSGLYTIQVDNFGLKPFLVNCDETEKDGGWLLIQRRIDGSIDFERNWAAFKEGFGNLDGEFFIGLDKLHALTTNSAQELLIVMEDFESASKFAKYSSFAIGDESEKYALKVLGTYSGDAGDSLTPHASFKFTTKDMDNDNWDGNCAAQYTGAWWHNKCHVSNLNGKYMRGAYGQEKFAQGIVWHTFRGYNYALKTVKMMIRPQRK